MLFSRFAPHGSSAKRHAIVATLSFVIIAAGCFASFDLLYVNSEKRAHQENSGITWVDFSPESLKAAHANGRHVIVDFTANWCMNCQYNLATALASDDVARLVDKKNILAMKADLTEANPAAESLMHQLGSRSVPFFAVFPGDAPYSPVIMRDILSKGEVVSVLRSLADK
jgi:thiol:disulfide interchange protein